MAEVTSNYTKKKWICFILSVICLFGPILFFFARAFVVGDTTQKLTMGITFTVALVLCAINLIMKSHLRSVIWVLLIGVFMVVDHYIAIIVVFAVACFLEELVFWPLYKYYKSKASINKEIDRRLGQ